MYNMKMTSLLVLLLAISSAFGFTTVSLLVDDHIGPDLFRSVEVTNSGNSSVKLYATYKQHGADGTEDLMYQAVKTLEVAEAIKMKVPKGDYFVVNYAPKNSGTVELIAAHTEGAVDPCFVLLDNRHESCPISTPDSSPQSTPDPRLKSMLDPSPKLLIKPFFRKLGTTRRF